MTAPIAATSPSTAPASDPRRAQLREAAEAFEAIFLRQLIGAMRSASLSDDPLSGASSGQFRDMADARVADDMASSAGFGIADMLMARFDQQGAAP